MKGKFNTVGDDITDDNPLVVTKKKEGDMIFYVLKTNGNVFPFQEHDSICAGYHVIESSYWTSNIEINLNEFIEDDNKKYIQNKSVEEHAFLEEPTKVLENIETDSKISNGVDPVEQSHQGESDNSLERAERSQQAQYRPDTSEGVIPETIEVNGGCFGGETKIFMIGEAEKFMCAKDIRKGLSIHCTIIIRKSVYSGMRVLTNKGATTVECVVKMKYSGVIHTIGQTVHLTSYHPVLIQDQCYFANELSSRTGLYSRHTITDDYVYDFILTNRGLLCCSYLVSAESTGIKMLHAATFGHSSQLEKFAHPYFGSEAVVDDLKRCRPTGYAEGCIVLDKYMYQRCDRSQNLASADSSSSSG